MSSNHDKTEAGQRLADIIADMFVTAAGVAVRDAEATDGQVAACLEACRRDGLATARQVATLLMTPTETFVATQAASAATVAMDDAGLDPEDCPRLAAACAEEWRRAFLCH